MAEPQDIPLSPTLGETVKSAFWRTPTASLLYQPLLVEKAFPTDETPIDDADIEKRLTDESLVDFAESFVHITTQGELEAQVGKIKHERKNDAIAAASGWTGFAVDVAAGFADPLSIATFKATGAIPAVRAGMNAKNFATRAATVAAEGAAGGAVAAGAIVAGNDTVGIEDAPGIVLGSALLPVGLYAGGSLARRMLGKAADMLPPAKVDELGEGLKTDLAKFEPPQGVEFTTAKGSTYSVQADGTTVRNKAARPDPGHENDFGVKPASQRTVYVTDADAVKLAEIQATSTYKRALSFTQDGRIALKYLDGDRAGKFESRTASGFETEPRKGLTPVELWNDGTDVHFGNKITEVRGADTRPEVEVAPERGVSDFAKRIEAWQKKEIDLQSADAKTVMAYNGRNTVDPYELSTYELAKSWMGDKAAKYMLSLGITRGAPSIELATSPVPAARRANALLNFTKGALDDTTNPESFYTKMEQVHAQRNQLVESMTKNFKSWRKKNLGVPEVKVPVIGGVITDAIASSARVINSRVTGNDFTEATFHDLAYRAMVYGQDVDNLPKQLRDKLLDPDVQAAAKSFRKFDQEMGERAVQAGLLRRSRLQEAHIGRNYHRDNISHDFERFIDLETEAAFNHQWNDVVRRANEQEAGDLKTHTDEHAKTVEKRTQEFDKETPELIRKEVTKAKEAARKEHEKAVDKAEKDAEKAFATAKAEAEAEADAWLARKTTALNNKAKREKWSDEEIASGLEDLQADASARLDERLSHKADVATNAQKRAEKRANVRLKKALNSAETEVRAAIRKDRKAERQDMLDALDQVDQKTRIKIKADRAKAISEANRIDTARWARQHAEGAFQAIATGQTGNRATERGAGNIRGSRIARNVFLSDRTLLDNGWLDTDLYKVVDKATRIDGSDAVLATLFRRPLTPEEIALVDRDSPDAYWADGADKYSAPDLELTVPIDEIRTQGEELRRSGEKNMDAHIERAIENLQVSTEIARGTFASGSQRFIGQGGRSAVALWKALQFSYYMGRSLMTNLADTSRLIATHGMRETLGYSYTRMTETARDLVSGQRGFTSAQITEQMKDANFGLDAHSFARVSGWLDVMDPWSAAARGNKLDQFAAKLTHIGSRAFGLHMWNNMITQAAGGMATNRIVRLAFSEGAPTQRDADWLSYIGLTQKDLISLRSEFEAQGLSKFEPYRTHIVDNDKLSDAARSKFLSALVREVRTTVVTPNPANLPLYMQNPVISMFMQFRSFSLEAAQSVHLRRAQIAASGDYGLAAQGLIAMMAGAYGSYLAKGMVESYLDGHVAGVKAKQKSLDKRLNAYKDNFGGLLYEVMDYGGVSPLLFTYNNMVDDAFGVGLKKGLQSAFGDKNPMGPLSSSRSQGRAQPGTLLGPGYRTLGRIGNVAQDVAGVGGRRITKDTIQNISGLIPYSGTFYLRGVTNTAVDSIAYGFGLPNKQPRR
jgi:hypothetical protein